MAQLKKGRLDGMGSYGFAIDALMSVTHCRRALAGAPVNLHRGVAMPAHPAALPPFGPCARDGDNLRAHPSQPMYLRPHYINCLIVHELTIYKLL